MKKTLLVLAMSSAATLLSAGVIGAQTLKFFIGPLQVTAGQKAAVPLQASGVSGLGAFELVVVYDPAVFDLEKVEKGPLLAGNMLLDSNRDAPDFTPGRLVVALVTPDKIDGDGVLLRIHGTVKGNPGQRSPLTIEKAKAFKADTAPPEPITVDVESGEMILASGGTPPPSPPPPPASDRPVMPGLGSRGPLIGLVVLLLGAAALGVGILLVLRRRAKGAPRSESRVAARLDVYAPDGPMRSVRITGTRITIGQRADNGLPIDDARVSHLHAEIVIGPGGFVLRDLNSTNGTWLNGRRVTESPLYAGDEIVVGSTKLVLGQ